MSTDRASASFREVQRFRQLWLWLLLVGVVLVSVVSSGLIGLVVAGAIIVFMWSFKLETEVRVDGLYVKFTPLHWSYRHVPWAAIDTVEAVTYRPLRDYGGWGIRFAGDGIAYNVSGSEGVRITRHQDRGLLVGSQRHYDLARAIRDAKQNARK